jgi:hypothetical protein
MNWNKLLCKVFGHKMLIIFTEPVIVGGHALKCSRCGFNPTWKTHREWLEKYYNKRGQPNLLDTYK